MNLDIKGYIGLLQKYLKKHWVLLTMLLLACIGTAVADLFVPKLLGNFVDSVKEGKALEVLLRIGVYYLAVVIGSQLFNLLTHFLAENLGWLTTNELRTDLTIHLMGLDSAYLKKFSSGQLVERIDGDVEQLFVFFTTFTTTLLLCSLQIIGCLIYLYILDWRFFTIELIFILSLFIYLVILRKPINELSERLREYSSEYFGKVSEEVTSVEDIRSLKAETKMRNMLRETLKNLIPWGIKSTRFQFLSWGFTKIMTALSVSVSLIIAAFMIKNGEMTIGKIFTLFTLMQIIVGPIDELREEIQYMESAEASIGRIKELFSAESTIPEGNLTMGEDTGIKAENVSFSYEDDRRVLNDINFNLGSGKVLGILGRTGSGKTTLARLLVRLYVPQEGKISLGGINVNDLTEKSLRKGVSYVTQEVQAFSGTVRDNITLYDKEYTDEKIMDVIEKAGMRNWFKKLPQGLDTEISDDAHNLSPGEMQLLVILRVFLRNPGIIILDEATAKLDPVTERYLESALDLLLKGRTTVIIAHRLRTVMRADEILILNDGVISEKGNTEELKNDENSVFSGLLKTGIEEVLV